MLTKADHYPRYALILEACGPVAAFLCSNPPRGLGAQENALTREISNNKNRNRPLAPFLNQRTGGTTGGLYDGAGEKLELVSRSLRVSFGYIGSIDHRGGASG